MQESIPKKQEVKKENTEIKNTKNWMTSFFEKIREIPSLEKIFKSSGNTARILTALVMLQGGQLFAQDKINDINTKDSFNTENLLAELPKMSINEIKERIKSLEIEMPENINIIFHQNIKEENNKITEEKQGEISDTGTINIITKLSFKSIREEKRNFNKTEKISDEIKDYFSVDLTILKDSSKEEIKKDKDIFIASEEGETSQEAIIKGIKKITREQKMEVFGATVSNETEINNKFNSNFTSVLSCETLSPLVIHVDKIEKTTAGTYIAYLSAQTNEK